MSARTGGDYVLGVSEAEAARLALQHHVFAPGTFDLWRLAGLAPGQRVLDLGCGPGHATLDLARVACSAPGGRVWAVDQSDAYLAAVTRRTQALGLDVRAVKADAQRLAEAMAAADPDCAPASLDLIYCRYLLAYPPRPGDVVRACAKLLRPGGRLVVQDFYNYAAAPALAPRSVAFDEVTRAVAAAIAEAGGDPDITGRLPALMADAGLAVSHLEAWQRSARPGTTMWAYRDAFYRGIVPRLAESGAITGATARAFFEDWDRASRDEHAFALGPTVVDIVAVKA